MRCEHCFYLDELNKHSEMSLDELDRLTRGLDPLSFLRVTGGEPFLRKDLPEVLHRFYQNASTRRMGVITNGSRPEWVKQSVERLFSLCPELTVDIGVSIDGLKETHETIRKLKGSFDLARQTVDILLDCKQRFANLLTSIVMTVTSKNENELDDLYEEVASWGVDRLSVNHVRGRLHDPSLLNVTEDRYEQFALKCQNYHLEKDQSIKARIQRAKNRIARDAIAQIAGGESSSVACLAGSAIGVLYSDGRVSLCEMFEEPLHPSSSGLAPDPILGNVRDVDYNFYTIWNSENTQQCREWIAETNCSCTHECFLTASILFGTRNYPKLIATALFNK